MSNFLEFAPLNVGMPDTAQRVFVASTNDTVSTVIAASYLTDKAGTFNNSQSPADFIANGAVQAGDVIYLHYDLDGTPGFTQGYVTNPSGTIFNFVVGAQGVSTATIPKKIVNGATFAGGAAAQTITDASVLSTDVVLVSVGAQTNAEALLKIVPGAGSFVLTFAADPGAGAVDYVVYASV